MLPQKGVSMVFAGLFLLSALAVDEPDADAREVAGVAEVIDGDTLKIEEITVRLTAIDAVEPDQICGADGEQWSCGAEAIAMLKDFVGGQQIDCISNGLDGNGQTFVTCNFLGIDLGEAMLQSGYAVALEGAPSNYLSVQNISKTHKIGIWSSSFDLPANWRAERAFAAEPKQEEEPLPPRHYIEREYRNSFGCAIKGNRSRRGDWIYHLPGQNYYEVTRPEELFCTETQARQAGYRRSKE